MGEKTVTTGKRNQTINEGMAPKDISLPVKKYSHDEPRPGVRDTTLGGGSSTPGGMGTK